MCFVNYYAQAQNCSSFLGLEVIESDSLLAEPRVVLLCEVDSNDLVVIVADRCCSSLSEVQSVSRIDILPLKDGLNIRSNEHQIIIDNSPVIIPPFAKFYEVKCESSE